MPDFLPPLRTQAFPFPLLSWFMDGCLHQDWDCVYENDIEALDDFCEDDGPAIIAELDAALTIPEADLYRIIRPLCGYNFGDSAHAWFEKLRAHLVAKESGSATK